jgi:hypothetical protein
MGSIALAVYLFPKKFPHCKLLRAGSPERLLLFRFAMKNGLKFF